MAFYLLVLLGFQSGHETGSLNQLFLDAELYRQIPAGTFRIGSDRAPDEQPIQEVTLSQSFYLGKYEVTQAQWFAVTGENPSHFKGEKLPVEMVTWADATNFIALLNQKLGGQHFRLPTEAEWEYACRAGADSDPDATPDQAWLKQNAEGKTRPVGTTKPNAWGLYDMRGNVWEWVADWYAGDYSDLADHDPTGPEQGKHHIIRGGDWGGDPDQCRCAFRGNDFHGGKGPRNVYGLRLVWITGP